MLTVPTEHSSYYHEALALARKNLVIDFSYEDFLIVRDRYDEAYEAYQDALFEYGRGWTPGRAEMLQIAKQNLHNAERELAPYAAKLDAIIEQTEPPAELDIVPGYYKVKRRGTFAGEFIFLLILVGVIAPVMVWMVDFILKSFEVALR